MTDFDGAANEIAIAATTQLFRLIRSGQMHDVASLLSQGALTSAANALEECARKAGGFVVVMYAGETAFVNGQPVRATRAVYGNILEVGTHLQKQGFNELTVRSSVRAEHLGALLDALKGERVGALPSSLTLQYVDPAKLLGENDAELPIVQQVSAVYGAATVLVRRCNDQLREDDGRLMRHVKRVAQRLVTLTRTGFVELLALARRPVPPTDHAAIAVNAAVIGALAGRALTEDIHVLLRITLGALQSEIGSPRVAGMYRSDGFKTSFVPQLNQTMRRRLPASTAVMLLQAGRAAEQPLMRAVVAYESAHLADGALLGWPYEGQVPPTVEAVISSLATRVAFAISNSGGPDDLVRMLAEVELGKVERAGLDLIFSILGLVSVGSPVELTSGWRGVVTSAGRDFSNLERPSVVLLLDNYRTPCDAHIVEAGGERGFVKLVITRADDLLAKHYEAWAKTRPVVDDEMPSTTGVLEPSAGDHIRDRATLDFDPEEATSVLDKSSAARFLPTGTPHVGGTLAAPGPMPSSSFEEPAPPQALAAPSAPKQFQVPAESSAPKQFQVPARSSAPKQFQQRESSAPKQFQQQEPSTPQQFQAPPKSSLARQFAGPKKRADPAAAAAAAAAKAEAKAEAAATAAAAAAAAAKAAAKVAAQAKAEAEAKAKDEGAAKAEAPKMVPGAWIRSAKGEAGKDAHDPDKPTDSESKKDDDSSDDDGDFDALANIILLD